MRGMGDDFGFALNKALGHPGYGGRRPDNAAVDRRRCWPVRSGRGMTTRTVSDGAGRTGRRCCCSTPTSRARCLRTGDGLWSFWNRGGCPVGVALGAEDDRWHALWESYPPRSVALPPAPTRRARAACAARGWPGPDGGPVEAESVRLYGTDSEPAASEADMAAYLDRLGLLAEAGALRTLFPYGMALRGSGAWVFFNREHGPLGVLPAAAASAPWRDREWPVRVRLPGLDRAAMTGLSHAGSLGRAPDGSPGRTVHFYDGGTVPTRSARDMDAYLAKLGTLMLLEAEADAAQR